MYHTRIEVNKDVLLNNIATIKNWIKRFKPKVKYCLPVKANAYGHGLVGVATIAQNFVDYFGVACLDEGIKLRSSGITKPILVFGAFADEQVDGLVQNNLDITISSMYKAEVIAKYCEKYNTYARVHIKVDTGMNRVGVRVESAYELIDFVLQNDCFKLVGLYSHLASSDIPNDEYTATQINSFAVIEKYVKCLARDVICHLANSGGVINYPESLFDMIRPGIMSYGYNSNGKNFNGHLSKIKPCFSLKSEVTFFKVVASGQGISYNHKWITQAQTRVVTIPIGYGDGFRRALSNVGEIILHNQKYRISGVICMDMLMVDIGAQTVVHVGDEVVLIGKQGDKEILLEEIAKECNTISYEILCGFNDRIARIYV